jgi:hypothetical protein
MLKSCYFGFDRLLNGCLFGWSVRTLLGKCSRIIQSRTVEKTKGAYLLPLSVSQAQVN